MARRKKRDWFACPVCGEVVAEGALACPSCGSDDRTGWSPETEYDGVDLPEDTPVDNAEDQEPSGRRAGIWMVWIAVVLIVLLLALALL